MTEEEPLAPVSRTLHTREQHGGGPGKLGGHSGHHPVLRVRDAGRTLGMSFTTFSDWWSRYFVYIYM